MLGVVVVLEYSAMTTFYLALITPLVGLRIPLNTFWDQKQMCEDIWDKSAGNILCKLWACITGTWHLVGGNLRHFPGIVF